MEDVINIMGYTLLLTCNACPEQYNVLLDGQQVGYLRLRHGHFTAEHPDVQGELVYKTEECKGNGIFDDDEREQFLHNAIVAIHNKINEAENDITQEV